MKRDRIRILIAVLLLVVVFSQAACGATKKMRFAAGGIGGNYYTFAEAFSDILKEENSAWKINVRITAGSEENVKMLTQSKASLGIAQTDVISTADDSSGFSAVAGLYTEACQFVVRADSGLKSIRDLRGKTVCVGESGSGSEKSAKQILGAYGLNDKMLEMTYLNYTDAAEQLRRGRIDAFFCTAGIQTEAIEKVASQIGIRILSIDGEAGDFVKRIYDHYSLYVIPAGTYTGQNEDVITVGVKAVLLASDSLSAGKVEELTAALFTHAGELAEKVPVDMELTEDEAVLGVTRRFHKGAAEYYASKGITVNSERSG